MRPDDSETASATQPAHPILQLLAAVTSGLLVFGLSVVARQTRPLAHGP